MTGYLNDPELGRIIVTLRRGMRNVRFGRKQDGLLYIHAPAHATLSQLQMVIDQNRAQLRQLHKPAGVQFYIGQEIPCFRYKVVITSQDKMPGQYLLQWDNQATLTLSVYHDIDLTQYDAQRSLSHALSRSAGRIAPTLLLPYARQVAHELGLSPKGLEVGRGMRKLGHCTAQGVIQLSRNLMFLPEPLVRYVICHELAHLTHLDHSPAFHRLLGSYLGGNEAQLEAQLRAFVWPILR